MHVSEAGPFRRMRPDACPGALQTHEAADGALARIRLPGGAVTAAQLRELAACAAELGSGVIELTSRANVQVRGLRPAPASDAGAALAARMAGAGLLPSASHERVRNIVASPLNGRGPGGVVETQPLVAALDRALCERARLAGLPGRFLFALDDGTGDVAGLGADVTYTPDGLLLADARLSRTSGDPVALMLAAAEAFLDERRPPEGHAQAGSVWRIGELPDGPARVAARLGGTVTPVPRRSPRGQRAGLVEQRDGRVALEAVVPLGRLTAVQAQALAAQAQAAGMVRLTPWRTVVLPGLDPDRAGRVAHRLAEAGLVTDPDSPWVGVTACTGRPGCAKSLADVQADASRWVAGRVTAPGTPVHWSGCERRCGLPKGPVVQLVATGHGYHHGYQERTQ
ncbi:precorrin-3B synthase [Nonomuraea muscovyensis]|uniref:precorrin-3B synthase n=1 Tax=Nonomuraea muscovyensis TaxID=1124761 RepID=UPI003405BE16